MHGQKNIKKNTHNCLQKSQSYAAVGVFLGMCSSLRMRDKVSHTYQTTRNVMHV